MCGCAIKVGTAESLKDMSVKLMANDVANYRTKDIMLCIYSASPSKFKIAYSNVMFEGKPLSDEIQSERDVADLAVVHDSGNDIKMYNVNFLAIAQAITHTDAELKNAQCTIGLIR